MDEKGQRIDKFLSSHLVSSDQEDASNSSTFSRSRIQSLIESGHVKISPLRPVVASLKIKGGDQITVEVPPLEEPIPQAQIIPLDIIFEDDDLLVINKPAGMVVHPAPGHYENTLVNALLAHCSDSLSGIGGVKRPGIVHRLDKETSGLMVVAKNDLTHRKLTMQFSNRTLSRKYYALVWGLPTPREGSISTLIGRHPTNRQKMAVVSGRGREAITHYKVTQHFESSKGVDLGLSLLECKLETGRTHQIRVHLNHIGHPLVGDPQYGRAPKQALSVWPESIVKFYRQALHAYHIQFIHPRTNELMTFQVSMPEDIQDLIQTVLNIKNQRSL